MSAGGNASVTGNVTANVTANANEDGQLVDIPPWLLDGKLFGDQQQDQTLFIVLMLWAGLTFIGTTMSIPLFPELA
jgi:hypothetical protein